MSQRTKLEINSFVKGLVTEAGPLTFPDNASLVDENFVLNKDGSRRRRKGLREEDGGIILGAPIDTDFPNPPSVHMWRNPLRNGSFDIVVVQVGPNLFFFNSEAVPLSSGLLNGHSAVVIPDAKDRRISVASARGQLVVTAGSDSIHILDYDETSDTISRKTQRLEIRDVFGIEDGFAVDERRPIASPIPTMSTEEMSHVYNLRNQGWPASTRGVLNPSNGDISEFDPVILPLNEPGDPPVEALASNADVFFHGKISASSDAEAVGVYSPYTLRDQVFGTSPAPRGRFIIDLFNRSDSRQQYLDDNLGAFPSGTVLPVDRTTGIVSTVASYNGRVFYAVKEESIEGGDSRTPRLGAMVFFSQVIEGEEDITKCYADADPTSEHIFDPIDTDGGFVVLPDAGEILGLAPLGGSLFVLTTNGVWEVHGGEAPFSATNVNVSKTTSIGALSTSSIVVAEEVITYWADGGIYMITIDAVSRRGSADNLTTNTIDTFYRNIRPDSKKNSFGVFDPVNRQLRWWFRSSFGLPYPAETELVFDVDLRAFYVNRVTRFASEGVGGAVALPEIRYLYVQAAGNSVSLGFYHYWDEQFRDPAGDAKARLLTGYLTGGTGSLDKQVVHLITHFARTETGFSYHPLDGGLSFKNPSGCIVTPQWEWTNSPSAGRWGKPFQAYRLTRPYYPTDENDPFDYGYTVVTAKHGIRGKGKALSLLFESEPGKDVHILGWGLDLKVNEKM